MFTSLRSTFGAALALVAATALAVAPAIARDSYVQDGASLFGASTVSSLNATIESFNRQTGKEVVVVTVPDLGGATAQSVAEKAFATQQVNGVLIFLAKAEKKDGIIPDRASARFFPAGSFDTIKQAMQPSFRAGDYDTGITTGVNLVINTYRGHEGSLRSTQHAYNGGVAPANMANTGGGGMSIFWLILILVAGFLIIRAIFRAISGPRVMPPGYGQQGPGFGGPGYGGPGYGAGGGFGGGGGGFFSGLLGGLGGAFIGNELFGRHDGGGFGGDYNNNQSGFNGGDTGNAGDSAGWQSDPGQADMGNSSFGDFGGGGGGGDFGGGGGDSGGGGW